MDGNQLIGREFECGEPWLCANGHMLGLIVLRKFNDQAGRRRRVYRLLKLGHALILSAAREMEPTEVAPVDVAGRGDFVAVDVEYIDCEIEGTVHDIRCDRPGCGEKRSWFIGEAALNMLLEGKAAG